MRNNLLRQCAVLLLTGVLLMPVMGKAFHAWEGHDWEITSSDQEEIQTPEVECSVCDYVQFNFHEELELELPVAIAELISEDPTFFAQLSSKLFIARPQLRGPPQFIQDNRFLVR